MKPVGFVSRYLSFEATCIFF